MSSLPRICEGLTIHTSTALFAACSDVQRCTNGAEVWCEWPRHPPDLEMQFATNTEISIVRQLLVFLGGGVGGALNQKVSRKLTSGVHKSTRHWRLDGIIAHIGVN